ncbi:hypothetical protein [Marinilactibacillus psychrotolerans]|uniref:hypothetical protein n=1 Tax=Marinilactibacillus psychrotolerans TaxID=191770 RepID=UPI003803B95D
MSSRRKFLSVIPVFESKNEKEHFEFYIKKNIVVILEKLDIDQDEEEVFDGNNDDNQRFEKLTQRSLNVGRILVKELEVFRLI